MSLTCDTAQDAAARISNAIGSSVVAAPSSPSSTLHSTAPLPSSSTVPPDDSGEDDCECDADGSCIDDGQDDLPAGDDECTDGNEPTPLTMAISTAAVPTRLSSTSQRPPAATNYSHGRRQAYDLVPASSSSMPIVGPTVTVVSTVTVGCGVAPTPFVSQVTNDPGVGFVSFGFVPVSAAGPSSSQV